VSWNLLVAWVVGICYGFGMIDMLVRLYDLPSSSDCYRELEEKGVLLRRARAFEKHIIGEWVEARFSRKWRSECEVAMARRPVSCWLATRDLEVLGFACYETTARGFFGPSGVDEAARGQGIGKALLFKGLESMREMGYAYAVIGGVGPRDFYQRTVGAVDIPGSDPGFYADLLPG